MKSIGLAILVVCLGASVVSALELTSIGPGGGGWVYAGAFDPNNDNTILIGNDMNGIYRTDDGGGHWVPWNNGLISNRASAREHVSYVQDLLAVDYQGTQYYAATVGGIFKASNAGLWTRDTDFTYSYDQIQENPPEYHNDIAVPFACLADNGEGKLYAGAGVNRWAGAYENWYGGSLEHYPGIGHSVAFEDAGTEYAYTSFRAAESNPTQQYTVWVKDLTAAGSWEPLGLPGSPGDGDTPWGAARDISVSKIGGIDYIAVSTIHGVYLHNGVSWTNICNFELQTDTGAEYTDYYRTDLMCWNVHITRRGTLYAAMHRFGVAESVGGGFPLQDIPGGVYRLHDVTVIGEVTEPEPVWAWVGDGGSVYNGESGIQALNRSMAEIGRITVDDSYSDSQGNNKNVRLGKYIWQMAVIDGDGLTQADIILAGTRNSGYYCMVRGTQPYRKNEDLLPSGSWSLRVFSDDHNVRQFDEDDSLVEFEEGHVDIWGAELIFQPVIGIQDFEDQMYNQDDVKVLVQFNGMLHKSNNAGLMWDNVFGEWVGDAWRSNGYEEVAALDIDFYSDGRMVFCSQDMGMYSSVTTAHDAWHWSQVDESIGSRRGYGVEVVPKPGGGDVLVGVVEYSNTLDSGTSLYEETLVFDRDISGPGHLQLERIDLRALITLEKPINVSDVELVSSDLFFASYEQKISEESWVTGVIRGQWDPQGHWTLSAETALSATKDLDLEGNQKALDLEYAADGGILYAVTSYPVGIYRLMDVATTAWEQIDLPEGAVWAAAGMSVQESAASSDGNVLVFGASDLRVVSPYSSYMVRAVNVNHASQGDIVWTEYGMPSMVYPGDPEVPTVETVALSPYNRDIVYVGINMKGTNYEYTRNNIACLRQYNGVWRLDLSGETHEWSCVTDGTPCEAMAILDIAFNPHVPNQMIIGTWGQGLYRAVVDDTAPRVVYEDRSGDLALTYEGVPYSVVPFDYNADGDQDVFIAIQDDGQQLYDVMTFSSNAMPTFVAVVEVVAPLLMNVMSARGASVSDIDNDGYEDLFIAKPGSAMLLHNQTNSQAVTLTDIASTYFSPSAPSEAWHGAWGDFNQDGWADLYVCCADNGVSKVPTLGAAPMNDQIYANNGGNHLFAINEFFGGSAPPNEPSHAAAWADVDNDGDLDIFIPSQSSSGGGAPHMLVNPGHGQFVDEYSARFPGISVSDVVGASWFDCNRDGAMDLAIACLVPGDGQVYESPVRVFVNDGVGVFAELTVGVPVLTHDLTDVRPMDYDLDGWTDLLVLPATSEGTPTILRNMGDDGPVGFVDVTVGAGLLSPGEVHGALAMDMNQDGDLDLFLGRPSTGEYYFNAKDGSGAESIQGKNWMGVELRGGGLHDSRSIGTAVQIWDATGENVLTSTQIVDGGSGRGSQQPHVLWFGLGDYSGDVFVKTTWLGWDAGNPYLQTNGFTAAEAIGEIVEIYDDTNPEIISTIPSVVVAHQPVNRVFWTVTWVTQYGSRPELDTLTIDGPSGAAVFTPVGVPHHGVVKNSDGTFTHSFVVETACEVGSYMVTVSSSTGRQTSTASLNRPKTIGFCVQ